MANLPETALRSLGDRLRERIRHEGPMSFHDWMQAVLYDKHDGYYCRSNLIRQGRLGDYRTAPETSPLFAATFARYFTKLFAALGSPDRLTIIEVGAGNGEFAHGLLTSLKLWHPEVFAATSYVIDEVSSSSRAAVSSRLFEFADRVAFQRLEDRGRSSMTGIIFSNELLDALPVHRVTLRDGELRELCVGLINDQFDWVACDLNPQVADFCRRIKLNLAEGQIGEINLEADAFIRQAAAGIEKGFVITVDYGAERGELWNAEQRPGGTLRAFRRHKLLDDILSQPGEVDLTTTIDWTQVKEAGEREGLKTVRHERLDQFLLAEGLLDELEIVAASLPDSDALRLRTSARELILPHAMASAFQVLVQQK